MSMPIWCDSASRGGRVVVIAPHGGVKDHPEIVRTPRLGDRRSKINDLHTADVATELATSLDASFLVNRAMDRNRLDLNRIPPIRRRAPWFLDCLAALVSHAVERHGEAYILVVHGWNIGQARCDVGVGADLSQTSTDSSTLTVSEEFVRERLLPFVEGSRPGCVVSLGTRYPARHRNNFLQLFRRDGSRCADLPDRLAEIVRSGRCQAVQLELGIPLRWPGLQRTRFLVKLSEVFGDAPPPRQPAIPARKASRGHSRRAPTSDAPAARALQAFDANTGVTVLASIDRFPAMHAVFGRIALFLPDGSVALYTGEASELAELGADGPSLSTADGRIRLRFEGSVLVTPDGGDYVDLERAMHRSSLAAASIELVHEPFDGRAAGRTRGTLSIGGERHAVDTTGFAAARPWGAWQQAERAQWTIRAAFEGRDTAVVRSGRASGGSRLRSARILLAGDNYAPEELFVTTDQRVLRVRPLSRMAIARPVGPRRRARVTFGPAAVECVRSRERGFGLYEYARLIDR